MPGVLSFGIRYVTPNPTHGAASIGYALPAGCQSARLSVYDVAGRLIRRLDPTTDSRGGFATVDWDGRLLSDPLGGDGPADAAEERG